jgi:WD40 repeat protein
MELKYVECATNKLEVKDICGMVFHNGYLLINQRTFLSVWDVSDPTNLQKINEIPYGEVCLEMGLFGDLLYVRGRKWHHQGHIHIFDVTDPLHITQKQELILQDEDVEIRSLFLNNNGRLFAGTKDYNIIEIHNNGTIEKLFTTNDYFADIIAYNNMLITSGGTDGIRIFNTENGIHELRHIASEFQMPTGLDWLEEGKTIIILGNDESIIKIDISDPAKAKRTKSAKTRIGLCEQFVRIDNTIYVLGTAIESRMHPPKICELDISDVSPVLKNKYTIKGYKQKSVGYDGAKGIVKIENYFLLATYHRQLGVVEII